RDSLGVDIPSVRSSLGQLKFGPEVAYRHILADDGSIEPRVKLEAIWNFSQTVGGVVAEETVASPEDWRGRVEVGLKMQATHGITLDLSGGYDGIGSSNYPAVTGQATARLPLH